MERKQSELTVITKAKDLCTYIMTVTQRSPKQFRFTFALRALRALRKKVMSDFVLCKSVNVD